jgi:O-antigen/teichoic acid export membrane protein
VRRRRALPEDQPRPRRPAPEGERGLTTGRRLARNALLSAVGEGSNVLLFLLGFLAARWLGPTAFGQYQAAFAFVGLFRVLPDFGMSYASTLEVSRDRGAAERVFGQLLGFQALLSALTLGLCLGVGAALFRGVTWAAVVVLAVDLLLKSAQSTLRWLLKAFERFGAESLTLLAERLLLLVAGALVLRGGGGVVGFVLVFAAVRALDTAALAGFVQRRVVRLAPAFDRAAWRELLRRGLPFAYAGAMITLFFQVDAVLLEQMRGPLEVGWYGAPVRILEGLTLVPRFLGYALVPTLAALATRDPPRVTRLYARAAKYLLVAGLPVAVFGALASEPLLVFVFGAAYRPGAAAAVWLLAAAPFMFLSNLAETTLACVNRAGTIMLTSTAALLLNVALNLALIPVRGYVGAALATLLTEAAYFAMSAGCVAAAGHRAGWPRLAARPLLAGLAFLGAFRACGGLGVVAAAGLATLAYLGALLALGVFDAQERELVLRLVGRNAARHASRL